MAHTIVSTGSEDNYGFSLEWIAEGSGMGEEICGVDKDCIVVPSSPIIPKIENEDYVEIQVTEEEVIAAQWDDNTECVSELEVVSGLTQDVLVPLDEEQDEYSRLHPYPCDFCSRRFSKQSSLTVHMLTHQTQRQHDCNMCGATYRRKMDLVEHMKIHSYAPIKEEDFDGLCVVDDASFVVKEEKKTPKVRKKKKKNFTVKATQPIAPSDLDFMDNFTTDVKQEFDDDQYYDQDQRFPVIDPARPYVCQFCGVGFAREKALISHKLVHAGDTTHECDRCNEVFQTGAMLQQHISSRHAKATKKSGNCSKKIIKAEVITEGYMCTMCHLVFSTSDELVLHKEHHDLGSGVHTCTLCHRDFVLLHDLRSHIKEAHGTTNVCSHCDQVFKDRFSLASHLMSHNSGNQKANLNCTVCNRKFPNKVSLKRHMATHETSSKDKSTTSILCTECGASEFADGRSLLYHRQMEHGVNMARLFPCLECGKTFNSRSSQQIHIRIHTGERPYGCRYCWKAFGDGGTLRKHERIHTGEKPYVCPVCSKAFNQRVVLREHIRAHHSGTEGKLSDSCYECMVCSSYFGTSEELCAHLVQHSDENTAKHRAPSVRKSNMNRKKKPVSPIVESLPSDVSPPRAEYVPVPTPKRKSAKSTTSDNLDAIVKLGKSTLDNLNSMASGKRARIVRSGKKGFSKGQNKRYLNKKEKGKTSKLLNNGSYAAKYAVSQPGVEGITIDESRNGANDERDFAGSMIAMGSHMNGDAEGSVRTRPRTKNVSYHNMRSDHKSFQLATFNDLDMTLMEGDFLAPPSPKKKKSCKKKKKTKRLFELTDPGGSGESEYINGITIEDHLTPEEQIETSIVSEVSDELELKSDAADGTLSCQICAEIFFSSDDLFRHIQSHF